MKEELNKNLKIRVNRENLDRFKKNCKWAGIRISQVLRDIINFGEVTFHYMDRTYLPNFVELDFNKEKMVFEFKVKDEKFTLNMDEFSEFNYEIRNKQIEVAGEMFIKKAIEKNL